MPSTQILVSKYHSLLKGIKSPGEIVCIKAGRLEHLTVTARTEVLSPLQGWDKDVNRCQVARTSTSNIWHNLSIKIRNDTNASELTE